MDLSIVILNYNGSQWLKKLMPSLKSCWLDKTIYQLEVVVVDNASTDDSLDYLSSLDYIRILRSDRNRGFAGGNNLALSSLQSRYVLLLNSDTELMKDHSDADNLIRYMDSDPQAAVVTPCLVLDSGNIDPACHRGEPTPWASLSYLLGLERLFPKSKCFAQYHQGWKNHNEIHTIDSCSGAAMLVRTSSILTTGLLDERFFMYAEDLDWCRRFRENNFRVVFYPGVRILHHKYKSGFEGSNPAVKRCFYETMLQYFDKHYRTRYPLYRFFLKQYISRKIVKIQEQMH